MEHNANKEKWIDEVMSSTRDMQRALPGADLYEQITAKLARPQAVANPFPVKQWAAAAILLLALNVGSVVYFASHDKKVATTPSENPIASEIQLETTYNY